MTASSSALAINGEQVRSGKPTAGNGDKRAEAFQSNADALAALRAVVRFHQIAAKPATLVHHLFSSDKSTTDDFLCAAGGLGPSGQLRSNQSRVIRTYAPGETAACSIPRWSACSGQLWSKVKPLTGSSEIRSRLLRPEIEYRISENFKNILFQEEPELNDVIGQQSNRCTIISNAPLGKKPDHQIRILPADAIRASRKTTPNKQVCSGTSRCLTWISLKRRTLEGVAYAVGGAAPRVVVNGLRKVVAHVLPCVDGKRLVETVCVGVV